MRIPQDQIQKIKSAILNLDPSAHIYLFGSRVDDRAKGGDIDLLIISKYITLSQKINLKLALYDFLGEQKIDLIIAKSSNESPFVEIAIKKGILL